MTSWRGKAGNQLSISVGIASSKEHPDLDLILLQKLADEEMYKDKDRFYIANPSLQRKVV